MSLAQVLAVLAPPLCLACGGVAPLHQPLCRECRGSLRWLPAQQAGVAGVPVWAAVSYEGPARELVRALKFRGAVGLVDTMAAQMAANAPPGVFDNRALVPVPLHPARLRKRGFNQAAELASALSRRTGLGVDDCLERTRGAGAATQVGRGRQERLTALGGSVRVARAAPAPARALLIDDVFTTGATLAACAAALRAAGTRDIAAIAYARTPGR